MTDKQLSEEELERADFDAYCESKGYGSFTTRELLWPCWQARATLARHPQPEGGEGLEVVGHVTDIGGVCTSEGNPVGVNCEFAWEDLCRLTDAQRLVAQKDAEIERLREALEFACKSLSQVTSSDGSRHADIALSVLRMAGVAADERDRLVEGWKATCRWRIDAALNAKPAGEVES